MYYLRDKQANKPTPIYLMYHVSSEKKNLRYATGLKINPKDWDFQNNYPKKKKGAITPKIRVVSRKLSQYSATLETILTEFELSDKKVTVSILKEELDVRIKGKERKILGFFDAYNRMMEQMGIAGKAMTTIKQYRRVRNVVADFEKHTGYTVSFERMDMDFYYRFISYCRNVRDNHDNNIGRVVGRIKTFLRWARKEGYHNNDKFLEWREFSYETDDISLTKEDVEKMENVELGARLDRVRDLFLIGVYSGQRYSDYSVFEKADIRNGMIVKRSKKMYHNSYIPIHSRLRALLEKYNFSLPVISSPKFNKYIKEVAEVAGLDDDVKKTMRKGSEKVELRKKKHEMVCSHTARRTFITLSLKAGMQPKTVMIITGIKDIQTLNKYNKINEEEVKDSMFDVWD